MGEQQITVKSLIAEMNKIMDVKTYQPQKTFIPAWARPRIEEWLSGMSESDRLNWSKHLVFEERLCADVPNPLQPRTSTEEKEQ